MKRMIGGASALLCMLAVHAGADIGVTIAPSSWAIGTVGPSYYIQSASVVVTNTGNCLETLTIKSANSADWALVTGTPGRDQFKLTRYDNVTHQWLDLTLTTAPLASWFADGTSTSTVFRFYGPASISQTPPQQESIQVMFVAGSEGNYYYSQAGDFYWRDATAAAEVKLPNSTWGNAPSEAPLPTQLWSYMPQTGYSTIGWVASCVPPVSTKGGTYHQLQGFVTAGAPGGGTSISSQQCPICGNRGLVYSDNADQWLYLSGYLVTNGYLWASYQTCSDINYNESTSSYGQLQPTWSTSSSSWYTVLTGNNTSAAAVVTIPYLIGTTNTTINAASLVTDTPNSSMTSNPYITYTAPATGGYYSSIGYTSYYGPYTAGPSLATASRYTTVSGFAGTESDGLATLYNQIWDWSYASAYTTASAFAGTESDGLATLWGQVGNWTYGSAYTTASGSASSSCGGCGVGYLFPNIANWTYASAGPNYAQYCCGTCWCCCCNNCCNGTTSWTQSFTSSLAFYSYTSSLAFYSFTSSLAFYSFSSTLGFSFYSGSLLGALNGSTTPPFTYFSCPSCNYLSLSAHADSGVFGTATTGGLIFNTYASGSATQFTTAMSIPVTMLAPIEAVILN